MSLVNDEKSDIFVVTYKEMLFVFIVFMVILAILYPKEILKQQILAENSNYDLSMLYLKNLLKHNPEDETLMLTLAEQSLRSGKKDLSLRLLELLIESKNKDIQQKAVLLSYELKKSDYFYHKTEEAKSKVHKELRYLFGIIYSKKIYDEKNLNHWYKESVFIGANKAIYFFLRKKIEIGRANIQELEQAYYFSIQYNRLLDAKKYVTLLIKYDGGEKWQEAYYQMFIKFKKYGNAEKFLKIKAKKSIKWSEKLAEFYLMIGKYQKANKVYLILFKNEEEYKKKRNYFYRALNVLQAGGYLKKATLLAQKYENYYYKDRDVRKLLLNLYIAAGDLENASRLSLKILRREFK